MNIKNHLKTFGVLVLAFFIAYATSTLAYIYNPTAGGGGGGGTVTQIDTDGSIDGGPITSSGTITLVNDDATPDPSSYYGTNSGGTKGYFPITAGAGDLQLVTDNGFTTTNPIWVQRASDNENIAQLDQGTTGSILLLDPDNSINSSFTPTGIAVGTEGADSGVLITGDGNASTIIVSPDSLASRGTTIATNGVSSFTRDVTGGQSIISVDDIASSLHRNQASIGAWDNDEFISGYLHLQSLAGEVNLETKSTGGGDTHLYLPDSSFTTLAVSVNGNFANDEGDITVPGVDTIYTGDGVITEGDNRTVGVYSPTTPTTLTFSAKRNSTDTTDLAFLDVGLIAATPSINIGSTDVSGNTGKFAFVAGGVTYADSAYPSGLFNINANDVHIGDWNGAVNSTSINVLDNSEQIIYAGTNQDHDIRTSGGTFKVEASGGGYPSGLFNVGGNGDASIGDAFGNNNSTAIQVSDSSQTIGYNALNGHTFTGSIVSQIASGQTFNIQGNDSLFSMDYDGNWAIGDSPNGVANIVADHGTNSIIYDATTQIFHGGEAHAVTLVDYSVVGSYIVLDTDFTIFGNTTGALGAVGAVLPDASIQSGRIIVIKNTGPTVGIDVTSAGGDIDGGSTVQIKNGNADWFQSDGTDWWMIGHF